MSRSRHVGQTHPAEPVVVGHYTIYGTLGTGNFSSVKLAQHGITNHLVALKIVKLTELSADNILRINREVEVLKKLDKHSHIIRLYQVIRTRRYLCMVTEYCTNGELYELLISKGRLNEPQSCYYFLQILSALEYLHDHNIVHRDLKAENLLLTSDYKTIKIADLGFANYYKKDDLLSTWCGSPLYAAPELFRGLHYVGPPVDIWSMGVILYVLVCGSLPFDGQNLVNLKSRVLTGKFRVPFFMTTECEGLIRSMLRLDPEKRFNIKQIRAHAWIKRFENSQEYPEFPSEASNSSGKSRAEAKSKDDPEATHDQNNAPGHNDSKSSNTSKNIRNSALISSFNQLGRKAVCNALEKDHQAECNRGQSLDMDESEDKTGQQQLTENEDASMLCLSNNADNVGTRTQSRSSDRFARMIRGGRSGASGNIEKKFNNLVNNDVANAISNMSIDSNNSSMSVSKSIETSQQSEYLSSLSSSKCDNEQPESSGAHGGRQLSKESSFDDQIIDFMVDNLKVANNQTLIREAIGNRRYDDLYAIYKLLKDQPQIMLEAACFNIPSVPLSSPSRESASKNSSINAGSTDQITASQTEQSAKTIETMRIDAHREFVNIEPHEPQHKQGSLEHPRESMKPQQIARRQSPSALDQLHSGRSELDTIDIYITKNNDSIGHRNLIDQMSIAPPQLFLTPPTDNRIQDQLNQISANLGTSFGMSRQLIQNDKLAHDLGSASKHVTARRSFDSTLNGASRQNEMPIDGNLAKRGVWDSSLLDTQMNSMNPSNPIMLRNEESVSSSLLDQYGENPTQLIENLARITTNLPQIGAQVINPANCTNLLLASLNSSACTAAMTKSGQLPHQHDPQNEQRIQPSGQIVFTPNNLVNQNYTTINTFALQAALKNTATPNTGLLDPEGLMSGLERRASDGQASYSSLTACSSQYESQTIHQQSCRSDTTSQYGHQVNLQLNPLSNSSSPSSFSRTIYSQDIHIPTLSNHGFQSSIHQQHRQNNPHHYLDHTQATYLDNYPTNQAHAHSSGIQISDLANGQSMDDSSAIPLDLSNKSDYNKRS